MPVLTNRLYGSALDTLSRLAAAVVGLFAAIYALTTDIDVIYSTNHFVHPFAKVIAVLTATSLVSFVG